MIGDVLRYRYTWLFFGLIALMLVSPIIEHHDAGEITLALLSLVVIVSAVNATRGNRGEFLISLALGSIWFIASVAFAIIEVYVLAVIADCLMIMFLVNAMYVIIQMLIHAKESDLNLLSAAACVYLIMAVAWALSYDAIEFAVPGSYAVAQPVGPGEAPSAAAFLYFSMTTLTTLGYGDLIPLTPMAGIWAALEAVAGVFYTTVLVARLVSLLRS